MDESGMDESGMDESRMDPSLNQPPARTPRRRPYRPVAFLLFSLLVAMLVTVTLRQSLDSASTPATRGSTNSVATDAPSSTPTPSAPFAFLDQALKTTSLRGYYAFRYTDSFADGSVLYVIVELPAPPTLADAQWDAFVIQRLAWSTPDVQPHTGWEIAVSFHVLDGACSSCVGQWGTHVGMADLKAATAVRLVWTRLTPEQAWQRYDGTLFDPSGLHP